MSDEAPPGPYETPLLNRLLAYLRETIDTEYAFRSLGAAPFTPPRAPLPELRVALVTTANLHARGDEAFTTMESRLGDTSFRVVPHDLPPDALALDAAYVDEKYVARDPEVALPRRALDALVAADEVGSAAPRHVSFAQGIVYPVPALVERAAEVLALFREDAVDVAVLTPT